MAWSEQQRIEFQAPEYLRNIIRIITESGLRVYKELMKEQVDLENAVVWIPDSKTPNGIAEVPLTDPAREVFREQIRISGPGIWLFPSGENPTGHDEPADETGGSAEVERKANEDLSDFVTVFPRSELFGSIWPDGMVSEIEKVV